MNESDRMRTLIERMQDRLAKARDSIVRQRERMRAMHLERVELREQVAHLRHELELAQEREGVYLKVLQELRLPLPESTY